MDFGDPLFLNRPCPGRRSTFLEEDFQPTADALAALRNIYVGISA
jgi:hypothetical protein